MLSKTKLTNQIFLVWGGNLELATALEARLRGIGIAAQIGGNASSSDSNYFLGPRVIEQMNRATHAIILAEPQFDEQGNASFRDNLMFEWGYLLGRMPSQHIFVALIGCKRSDLPSDLQGAFAYVVPNGSELLESIESEDVELENLDLRSLQARNIYRKFQDNLFEETPPSHFEILINWPVWRNFLEEQRAQKMSSRPKLVRAVMSKAFIAIAYYQGELGFYLDYFDCLDMTDVDDVQDLLVAKGVARYLQASRNSSELSMGDFDLIKATFSNLAAHICPLISTLTRYAMALCLQSESFIADHKDVKRRQLREFANDNLEIAIKILENKDYRHKSKIGEWNIDTDSKNIIKALILTNLAKVSCLLDNLQEGASCYREGITLRQRVQQKLDLQPNNNLAFIYRVETNIHYLRLLEKTEQISEQELSSIESDTSGTTSLAPHQLIILKEYIKKCRNVLDDIQSTVN